MRSQPVSSLIRTGLGCFEEAEYLPKRKTSFSLTDFPMRYSRSLSISDLSSRMESLSGSPKRTRLQALESEILDDTLGPIVERVAAALVGVLDGASAKEVEGGGGIGLLEDSIFSRLTWDVLTSVPSIHLCCAGPVQQLGLDSGKEGVGGHWPHSRWEG